jgi:hypothetical protein
MNILFIFKKFIQIGVGLSLVGALNACGGGGPGEVGGAALVGNAVALTVSGGLQNQSANLLLTSVTVCVPNLSACKTIDNVQVDTGSTGLRLFGSALTGLGLQRLAGGAASSSVYECAAFGGGYLWGAMARADVKLGQELASNVSIQLVQDGSGPSAPSSCTSFGADLAVAGQLGVNGVLGVGPSLQDCGAYCASVAGNGRYFQCASQGDCIATTAPLASQAANPVANFTSNNNGVVIDLPSAPPAGARQLSGQMVFGINTQPNNTMAADITQVLLAKSGLHAGRFSASLNGILYPDSTIDSGAGANFFNDASLPVCGGSAVMAALYCPGDGKSSAVQVREVLLAGAVMVTLPVANASYLFAQPATAFGNLAGPGAGGQSTAIRLGLPFFMGRRVYTGFDTSSNPSGPYFAFKS